MYLQMGLMHKQAQLTQEGAKTCGYSQCFNFINYFKHHYSKYLCIGT